MFFFRDFGVLSFLVVFKKKGFFGGGSVGGVMEIIFKIVQLNPLENTGKPKLCVLN